MDYSQVDWSQAVQSNLADLSATKEKMAKKPFEKKEVDLTKYFSLNLGKTEKTGSKVFRMLPDSTNPFEFKQKVFFHHIKVGEDWKKLYDPEQEGQPSPLNDARQALLSHPDKEVKKQSVKYKSKLFYIIRGIERGKEHEGVKFWRFPAVNDGSGIMDKIESLISIYNMKKPGGGAFWNPIAGRDLIIALSRDEQRGFTKVSNMMVDDESPLSADAELTNKWLNDPTKWEDVYKKYSTEYLRIVAEGSIPTWSKDANDGKGGYVAKAEDSIAGAPATSASAPAYNASTATSATTAISPAITAQNTVAQNVPVSQPAVELNESATNISLDDLPF